MSESAKKFQDPAMQNYFSTLSPAVRECIIQSGLSADNIEQLQNIVRQFTGSPERGIDIHGNYHAF